MIDFPAPAPPARVFIATVTPAQIIDALKLAEKLRDNDISVISNLEERSLKRQLEQAAKAAFPCVLILGEDEIAAHTVTVRDMTTGQQKQIPREPPHLLVEEIERQRVGSE